MPHFYVLAILPQETLVLGNTLGTPPAKIEPAVENLLATYNASLKVPTYITDCSCVGWEAERDGRRVADEVAGTEFAEKYSTESDTSQPLQASDYCAIAEAVEAQHARFGLPDKKCKKCKGRGTIKSTKNPKAKWSWWVIGGKWHGVLLPPATAKKYAHIQGPPFPPEANSLTAGLLLARPDNDWVPFAVVTPDGAWHEKDLQCWWAETEDWNEEVRNLMEKYSSHTVVGLDLHA